MYHSWGHRYSYMRKVWRSHKSSKDRQWPQDKQLSTLKIEKMTPNLNHGVNSDLISLYIQWDWFILLLVTYYIQVISVFNYIMVFYSILLDSYVKVCLLVQNKIVKSKKTEVIKKTDSPNFSESFTFKLPVASLDSASINITAMQHQSGYKGR